MADTTKRKKSALEKRYETEVKKLLQELADLPKSDHAPVAGHIRSLEIDYRIWTLREAIAHDQGKVADALDCARAAAKASECVIRARKATISDRLDRLEEAQERQNDNVVELRALH